MKKLKLITVVGTRPEIIRLSRSINSFDKFFDHILVHTNQNYDKNLKHMAEDFELELRMLKTHGFIKNLPNVLLWYRVHSEQVTNGSKTKDKGGANSQYWNNIRNNMINKLIN